MKTKIVFAVTLLLMIVSVHGFAQSKSKMTDEQKKEMMDRYKAYREKLNLTDEQSLEVQKINTEYFETLADLKKLDASTATSFGGIAFSLCGTSFSFGGTSFSFSEIFIVFTYN